MKTTFDNMSFTVFNVGLLGKFPVPAQIDVALLLSKARHPTGPAQSSLDKMAGAAAHLAQGDLTMRAHVARTRGESHGLGPDTGQPRSMS